MFSEATKSTYSVHLKSYLKFCATYKLKPCPAESSTLARYISYLARSKCYNSVAQYLNIIRLIHQECGYQNPLKDNWQVATVLRGVKRGKGQAVDVRAPLLPPHLELIRDQLNLELLQDLQFWAITIIAFFGLLRIGNLTPPNSVRRKDMLVTASGISLVIYKSKTIQYRQRVHSVVLPYIPGHKLCPVTALLKLVAKTPSCSPDAPLCAIMDTKGHPSIISASGYRARLNSVTSRCPQIPSCSTHSLRKGGATWLLSCGVPLAVVRIMGDWASDAVFKYLLPDNASKFQFISSAIASLYK